MQETYIKRINHVLAFIETHLDEELSLQSLAAIAFYSPFHFHRLFLAITNETLNTYITRKRIERSAILLIHHKEYSIGEIATKNGFKNDSTFSKTFKKIYGESPSAFRKINKGNLSKIGQVNSNNGQVKYMAEKYLCNIKELKTFIKMHAKIDIKELPTMNLAYVTHIGVDGLNLAFQRIIQWAGPKGLLGFPDTHVCRVFHDSFKVTAADKVRMSVGICSPQQLVVDQEIGNSTIEKGRHIVGRFEIEPIDFEQSWNGLFIWMTEQGFQKADKSPFEIYHNNFNEHPEKKCIVDLCIPIL
ncbi:MAG: AraC family transcriptional regulator [Flavobacterium sp. BFFFF2]|nr:MAG: AraC family transcriptional regulator [Flavobacterium sp. BFFFF2]